MKTPCYKCEKRATGCHAVCEEYKSFTAEVAALRGPLNGKEQAVNFLVDGVYKWKRKIRR